jgi:hypothetical protein
MWFPPHIGCEHTPRHRLTLMAEKIGEQFVFTRRKENVFTVTGDAPIFDIYDEIADLFAYRFGRGAAPQKNAHPSQQFCEREGFDEIVVGAAVESEYAIFDSVACG